MFDAARAAPGREIAKWCACALILLAPGSLVIVPLLWLARQWSARGAALAPMPHSRVAEPVVAESPRAT